MMSANKQSGITSVRAKIALSESRSRHENYGNMPVGQSIRKEILPWVSSLAGIHGCWAATRSKIFNLLYNTINFTKLHMLSNLIQQTYTNNCNYKITHSDSINNGKCFIFFSGHGIFYPDTEEEFVKTIIVNDRYEWNTSKPSRFSKIIQVRDLKKSWYLDGINK